MSFWTSRTAGLAYLDDLQTAIDGYDPARTNLITRQQDLHDRVLPFLLDQEWPTGGDGPPPDTIDALYALDF